jgi:hypothetical protein
MSETSPDTTYERRFEATFGLAEQLTSILTYIFTIALLFLLQVIIKEGFLDSSIPSWVFLIPVFAVAAIWLYSPREYVFRDEYIEIKRVVIINKIYYHQITQYVINNQSNSELRASSILPIQFLPHIRKIHDSRFSCVKIYANRVIPSIILKTSDGAYLLSCENISEFAQELRSKIDLSKSGCPCGDTL